MFLSFEYNILKYIIKVSFQIKFKIYVVFERNDFVAEQHDDMPSERKGGTKDSTQEMCNQAARIIRRRRQKEIVGPKAKQDVTEVMISQIMLAETNQEERAFSRFY